MSHLRLLPVVVLLAACPNGTSNKTLILLHTTDEHSHVLGFGPELDDYPAPAAAGSGSIRGGIGRRSALITQERARAKKLGADSLLVSAGDNTMGTLVQVGTPTSAPDFQLMKQLGYDVTTLGNHEFDFGPDGLAAALMAAQAGGGVVPTVSSNINIPSGQTLGMLYDAAGTDATKPIHKTWVVTTPNGLKVGFVGIVGVDAAAKAPAKAPVTFSIPPGGKESDPTPMVLQQIYADLQPSVDHLRNDLKVDVVVALSHSGVDAQNHQNGEDYQIAQNVSGIDVIVSGHTHLNYPVETVMNTKTGKPVYIQQANCYSQQLARMQLVVGGGKVTLDTADTTILDVNDSVVSDPSFNPAIDKAITEAEAAVGFDGKPVLATALSRITGTTVTDDTSKVGDLYFYPIGKTSFSVVGQKDHEDTPLLDLWADAELLAADGAAGKTDVSIVARGALRSDLDMGKTGVVSFADVFRAVPLGISSVAPHTFGYPLCRTYLTAIELKAAFEVMAGYSYSSSDAGDYYLVGGGIQIAYDTSRPIFDPSQAMNYKNGRVTKMTLASDHTKPDNYDKVIFDVNNGGFTGSATALFSVAGSLYVIDFAYVAGVGLKDQSGTVQTPEQTIVHRADGSEIKDWEALAQYIHAQPNSTIPSAYMTASHNVCSGPLCVQ